MPAARLEGLDVARGIAILGTLGTNVWVFTAPAGLMSIVTNNDFPTDTLTAFLRHLPNGKFLGLLTLLFGMGIALQQASARRRGEAWPGRYPWRAVLLLIDGALHFLLVAEFDVLMGYAVTGLLVAILLNRSERMQRTWIAAAAACHVLVMAFVVFVVALAPDTLGTSEDTRAAQWTMQHGSWWDLVRLRWDHVALFRVEPLLISALSLALFLLGAQLLRAGIGEADATGAALRRRLLIIGAVALPVDLLLGTFWGRPGGIAARYVVAPLVAIGLLALILGACSAPSRGPLTAFARRRLAEVGRTALSCYILQNIICSAICYGWGLGLAGRIDAGTRTGATLLLFAGVSGAILACAFAWLRVLRQGPLEWLLHVTLQGLPGGRAAAVRADLR